MAGLVPAIHVLGCRREERRGCPGLTMDKPGHDEEKNKNAYQ
jgi:hypothetical protein